MQTEELLERLNKNKKDKEVYLENLMAEVENVQEDIKKIEVAKKVISENSY